MKAGARTAAGRAPRLPSVPLLGSALTLLLHGDFALTLHHCAHRHGPGLVVASLPSLPSFLLGGPSRLSGSGLSGGGLTGSGLPGSGRRLLFVTCADLAREVLVTRANAFRNRQDATAGTPGILFFLSARFVLTNSYWSIASTASVKGDRAQKREMGRHKGTRFPSGHKRETWGHKGTRFPSGRYAKETTSFLCRGGHQVNCPPRCANRRANPRANPRAKTKSKTKSPPLIPSLLRHRRRSR